MAPSLRSDETCTSLEAGLRAGEIGALARAISWAENQHADVMPLLNAFQSQVGRAWRTGVTGPPGAGKSTLVDALVRSWYASGKKSALLAVDPSSPLTGGALLGDRVRLDRSVEETDVYVRSMANRGSLGGLSRVAGMAADFCDAAGYDEIILETVGVGQAEVDIASASDVTVVILTPASGDGVQAMKAGLMEIGDVFVVNKADLDGADRLKHEIETMLELRASQENLPEVLTCSALQGVGMDEVVQAIERRRQTEEASGLLKTRREQRAMDRVQRLVRDDLRQRVWSEVGMAETARTLLADGQHPDCVAQDLIRQVFHALKTQGDFS